MVHTPNSYCTDVSLTFRALYTPEGHRWDGEGLRLTQHGFEADLSSDGTRCIIKMSYRAFLGLVQLNFSRDVMEEDALCAHVRSIGTSAEGLFDKSLFSFDPDFIKVPETERLNDLEFLGVPVRRSGAET